MMGEIEGIIDYYLLVKKTNFPLQKLVDFIDDYLQDMKIEKCVMNAIFVNLQGLSDLIKPCLEQKKEFKSKVINASPHRKVCKWTIMKMIDFEGHDQGNK